MTGIGINYHEQTRLFLGCSAYLPPRINSPTVSNVTLTTIQSSQKENVFEQLHHSRQSLRAQQECYEKQGFLSLSIVLIDNDTRRVDASHP